MLAAHYLFEDLFWGHRGAPRSLAGRAHPAVRPGLRHPAAARRPPGRPAPAGGPPRPAVRGAPPAGAGRSPRARRPAPRRTTAARRADPLDLAGRWRSTPRGGSSAWARARKKRSTLDPRGALEVEPGPARSRGRAGGRARSPRAARGAPRPGTTRPPRARRRAWPRTARAVPAGAGAGCARRARSGDHAGGEADVRRGAEPVMRTPGRTWGTGGRRARPRDSVAVRPTTRAVGARMAEPTTDIVETSDAGWMERLAGAYRDRATVVVIDDAGAGIEPRPPDRVRDGAAGASLLARDRGRGGGAGDERRRRAHGGPRLSRSRAYEQAGAAGGRRRVVRSPRVG